MPAVEFRVRRRRVVLAATARDTTGLEMMYASAEESATAVNEHEALARQEFEQREYPIDLPMDSLLCAVSTVLAALVPVRDVVD